MGCGGDMKTRCSNTAFKIYSVKKATDWRSYACYVYGQCNCSCTGKGSSAECEAWRDENSAGGVRRRGWNRNTAQMDRGCAN